MRESSSAQVTEILLDRAETTPDTVVYSFGATEETMDEITFGELRVLAERWAASLRGAGVGAGDRVAIMLPNGLDYVASVLGVMAAGAIAVPLFAARTDSKGDRLDVALLNSRPAAVVARPENLDATLAILVTLGLSKRCAIVTNSDLGPDRIGLADREPATIAFLQYTSGSTSEPKAVQISDANIIANSASIGAVFGHDDREIKVGVCWLPLFHDMGLVGSVFHTLVIGARCHIYEPSQFLLRPANWLRLISALGAHTSGGPNFGFDWCVDHVKDRQLDGVDLSSWKVAYNGSEPISSRTIDRFVERFAPFGFERTSFLPCYGLAEFTLLVSGHQLDRPEMVHMVHPGELSQGHVVNATANAQPLVSSGVAAPNTSVRIVDRSTGAVLGDDLVGDVHVAGPSLSAGYWQVDTESNIVTRAIEGKQYLATGDVGYMRNGHLVVLGRDSELIVLRGRNFVPQDLEATVEGVLDMASGLRCVAGGQSTNAGLRLVIVCEIPKTLTNLPDAAATVRRAVASNHGVQPGTIAFVPKRSVPVTTSGKKRRADAVAMLTNSEFELLYVDELPAAGLARHPRPALGTAFVAPAGSVEEVVSDIWADVLGYDQVGRHDNFLELGGDSIKAAEVASRLEIAFGIEVRLTNLFEAHTVAALAEILDGLEPAEDEDGAFEDIEL